MHKVTEFLKGRDDLPQFDTEDIYSDVAEQFGCLLFDRKLYSGAIEPFKEAILFAGTQDRKRYIPESCDLLHPDRKAPGGRADI